MDMFKPSNEMITVKSSQKSVENVSELPPSPHQIESKTFRGKCGEMSLAIKVDAKSSKSLISP